MNAEIVGVGTELLLGQIANTNAQRISAALAGIGVDVFYHSTVGDNPARMRAAFEIALGRADVVIITGGLGPTPDDITREVVADVLGRPLEHRAELATAVTAVFERMNRPMPPENLKQAELPAGAIAIPPEGTAPGFYIEHDGRVITAMPGVPWEMDGMLYKTVLPLLSERAGASTIVSRQILVVGLGESMTHTKIADIVEAQSNPTIAYLAGSGQVRVRLTAKAGSEAEALALIEPVEARVRERLGSNALAGNHDRVAEALADLLRARGITIGVAESLTGGLIGAELTRTKGSGDYFKGSLVVYTPDAKRDVVGVDEAIILGPGTVSEEAAAALAEGAAARLAADLGISATGVAGPAEEEGKPVGTVYVGAAFGDRVVTRHVMGYGDRDHIRAMAGTAAMDLGRRLVESA